MASTSAGGIPCFSFRQLARSRHCSAPTAFFVGGSLLGLRDSSWLTRVRNDFREKVFGHEQVKARDMVQQYTHPALGIINCVGHPVKFRYLLMH